MTTIISHDRNARSFGVVYQNKSGRTFTMRSLRIIGSVLIASLMLAAQPNTAQASPESRCLQSQGSYQWDGVGLRYCCTKYVRTPGVRRLRPVTLWCIP
jgi:hypothetical protein